MKTTTTIDIATKNAAHVFMEKITRQYDVSKAFLFGSRARHSHQNESDADIAVFLKGNIGRFVTTKFAMDDLPTMFYWKLEFESNHCLFGKKSGISLKTIQIQVS
jgi:predicted nucleotidyltransferase